LYKPLVKWPQRSPDLTIINMFLWQPGRQVARATRFWKKAFNICGSLVWNWLYVYLMVSSDPPPQKKILDNLRTCVLWGFLKKTTCTYVDVDNIKDAQDTIAKACENPRHDIPPRSETSRTSGLALSTLLARLNWSSFYAFVTPFRSVRAVAKSAHHPFVCPSECTSETPNERSSVKIDTTKFDWNLPRNPKFC